MNKCRPTLLVFLFLLLSVGMVSAAVEVSQDGMFGWLFSTISPTQGETYTFGNSGGTLQLKLLAYPCGAHYTCNARAVVTWPTDDLRYPTTIYNDIPLRDSCDGYACNKDSNIQNIFIGTSGSHNLRVTYDCRYNNDVCTVPADDVWFNAQLTSQEECSVQGSTRCQPGTNIQQWCSNGVWNSAVDCASVGLTCVMEAGAMAHCVDESSRQTCPEENAWRCNGEVREKCLEGYWYAWQDCESRGETCVDLNDPDYGSLVVCRSATDRTKANDDYCFFDDECVSGYCKDGACSLREQQSQSSLKGNGEGCLLDSECQSGSCEFLTVFGMVLGRYCKTTSPETIVGGIVGGTSGGSGGTSGSSGSGEASCVDEGGKFYVTKVAFPLIGRYAESPEDVCCEGLGASKTGNYQGSGGLIGKLSAFIGVENVAEEYKCEKGGVQKFLDSFKNALPLSLQPYAMAILIGLAVLLVVIIFSSSGGKK